MNAAIGFLQFNSWNELVNYCNKYSYTLIAKKEFPIIAEVINSNNALVGYVSDRPRDFKPINPTTKYVLVWE